MLPAPKITTKDWLHCSHGCAVVCRNLFTANRDEVYLGDQRRFLTGLYVPLVPLLGLILYKRKVHWVVWPAALGCLIGTWLLTDAGQLALNVGDLWVLGTVIPFTLHVLWVGGLAERLHAPLLVAWGQFIVCGVLALLFSLPLETFDWNNLSKVFWPLAYMVFISVGIGFTGQVIGQRYAPLPKHDYSQAKLYLPHWPAHSFERTPDLVWLFGWRVNCCGYCHCTNFAGTEKNHRSPNRFRFDHSPPSKRINNKGAKLAPLLLIDLLHLHLLTAHLRHPAPVHKKCCASATAL